MKWLLITNDNDITLNDKVLKTLNEKNCKNKLVSLDFNAENIKKQLKKSDEYAGCFIIQKDNGNVMQEELSSLLICAGYFLSKKVTLFTNISFLCENILFDKANFSFDGIDNLIEKINKNYDKISESAVKRLAKNKLLERGIPFTSDCFATYIAKNKIEVVNEFLEAGMSINEKDDAGVPMLNIACRNDNFDFVKMFLELGADIDAVSDDRGYTAVMDAVWRGNEKITKFLIEKGADLNTISKEGQSNLVLAVGAGRENIVKLLAENGSDCDVKDMMGMSAYNYAVLFKKTRIVDILKPFHKE